MTAATILAALRPDHLVVMAESLQAGVQWCQAKLGVTPGAGGEHPLMGTHNRLFRISSASFPDVFFEIIAIRPGATPERAGGLKRWFDMDDAALQARIARDGPQLIHWVAQCADVRAAVQTLERFGISRGAALPASRMTPAGLLRWQITVRDDGQRLYDGVLPTLIEWGDVQPAASMADVGVSLQTLRVQHPLAAALHPAWQALGLSGVPLQEGPACITAMLNTPKGLVELRS
jgi:hypothetical protein